jgi:hypothetical protein
MYANKNIDLLAIKDDKLLDKINLFIDALENIAKLNKELTCASKEIIKTSIKKK